MPEEEVCTKAPESTALTRSSEWLRPCVDYDEDASWCPARGEKSVQVQDIMTRDVTSARPLMNISQAAEIMWNKNCGYLPVVADDGRLIGMVTDRDLFIALGRQNPIPADAAVGEVMRPKPSVCSPQADLCDALTTMATQRVRRLPVVNEAGLLQGILSFDDLILRTLKALCEAQTGQESPDVEWATA